MRTHSSSRRLLIRRLPVCFSEPQHLLLDDGLAGDRFLIVQPLLRRIQVILDQLWNGVDVLQEHVKATVVVQLSVRHCICMACLIQPVQQAIEELFFAWSCSQNPPVAFVGDATSCRYVGMGT